MIGCDIMARVQKTNQTSQKSKSAAKKGQKTNVNPKSRQELAKTNAKSNEPSKNEIMFFRIGIIVIVLTVIIGTVIVLIQYFMNNTEKELPFDDYLHLTTENLAIFVAEDGLGTFGDRDYYFNVDGFEDLHAKINQNDILYVYFYKGSNIDQEVVDAILALENLEDLTFLFIDIDKNPDIFQDARLAFLSLNSHANQMLLTFDYDPEDPENRFTVWFDQRNILIDINKL